MTQSQILGRIQDAGFNVCTCGNCGSVVLATTGDEVLECQYCGYKGGVENFPDLYTVPVTETDKAGVIFHSRFGNTYRPDNAEEGEEDVSFEEMAAECGEALLDSKELRDMFPRPSDLLMHMVIGIDWEYPSTFIENIKAFN